MTDTLDAPLQTIPARSGRAQRLEAGSCIVVINTHGTQVLDTWAFALADPSEFMSMEHTRSVSSRWRVGPGMVFVSNRRRPMLRLLEDSSPGVHDMLLPACSPEIYRELGCDEGHASCQQNLHHALATQGLRSPLTPAPLNLFMNVPIAGEGTLDRTPPSSRPGDRVVLQAEMPLWIVFSACPQDVTVINGAQRQPTEAHYRVVAPPEP
jgi:uncharacterized protein YcgI (DUF1989 family)